MANFNPSMIIPVSKSAEFAASEQGRTAKAILLEGIAKQVKLFRDPKEDGRRWFTLGQKEVALTLRIGNKPLKLSGEETKVAVPVEHFEGAMQHFKSRVEAGYFDSQLTVAEKAMEDRRTKLRNTRANNKKAK